MLLTAGSPEGKTEMRTSTRKFMVAGLCTTLAICSSHVAHSQSYPFEVDVVGTAMSGAIMDAAREPSGRSAPAPRRGDRPSDVSTNALTYTSSPARTRANIAMFANKSRAVDPNGAAELERLFASQDVMALVEGEMRKIGLTKNNLADAYTIWWTNAWLATQGRNDDLPRAQMQAVKRQAERALSSTAEVGRLNDAGKQEFAEALLVQAMLIAASVDTFKQQGMDLGPLKAAVIKGARATGVDLESMTLTDDGFRTSAVR